MAEEPFSAIIEAAQRAYERWRVGAEPAYAAWTGRDIPWEKLSPEQRDVWVQAIRAAGPIPKYVRRLETDTDLGEFAFDYARQAMGGPPAKECTVVAGPASSRQLRELKKMFGCHVVELPEAMLPTIYSWALISEDGKVWSTGVC